jgi:hypothetical protein
LEGGDRHKSKNHQNTIAMGITLRKMFSPVKENSAWRIRTNQKFMNLYTEPYSILHQKSEKKPQVG